MKILIITLFILIFGFNVYAESRDTNESVNHTDKQAVEDNDNRNAKEFGENQHICYKNCDDNCVETVAAQRGLYGFPDSDDGKYKATPAGVRGIGSGQRRK